jgi:hypothetical protein
LAIVSLFHDLCKCDCYKLTTRNQKNEATGQWEKVPVYQFEEKFHFGGHGEKSVYLLMRHGMMLTEEEAAAINTHMGFSGAAGIQASAISDVYNSNLLAWMLHVADEAATYIDKV